MRAEVEVLVIGGGVVGLAVGAALARSGREVILLEREEGIGRGISSRNSQVIHSGLYYPKGSKKALHCVRGRKLLIERCRREGIPHRATGKIVVAVDDAETAALERLLASGRANGVEGLALIDAADVRRREPDVKAVLGLVSPESGVVDAHALCLSFAAELEGCGGTLVLGAEVFELSRGSNWTATIRRGGCSSETLRADVIVNAAGLAGDHIAELAGLDVDGLGFRHRLCKGDYFALAPSAPLRLRHLVYPLPDAAGLGVHATVDLGGRIRFGPDATYVDGIDFAVDATKAAVFAQTAGRYLPALRAEWLSPDQAGIRPKLSGPGEPLRDFVIEEAGVHGAPGLINLIGIESPGLTAAPAIAEHVARELGATAR